MTTLFPDTFGDERSAVIDGEYRYLLTRRWGPERLALWVMLNPSLADSEADDNTIRRVTGFTRRLGLGGFRVVNHFALISPYPSALQTHPDPIGPQNGRHIGDALNASDVSHVVCAWGAHSAAMRTSFTMDLMIGLAASRRGGDLSVLCFGLNQDGSPKHPLYLSADEPFVDYLKVRDDFASSNT